MWRCRGGGSELCEHGGEDCGQAERQATRLAIWVVLADAGELRDQREDVAARPGAAVHEGLGAKVPDTMPYSWRTPSGTWGRGAGRPGLTTSISSKVLEEMTLCRSINRHHHVER